MKARKYITKSKAGHYTVTVKITRDGQHGTSTRKISGLSHKDTANGFGDLLIENPDRTDLTHKVSTL